MKRFTAILLSCLMLVWPVTGIPVMATDSSSSYSFELTVNGAYDTEVNMGDTVTVTVKLSRTRPAGDITMYAVDDRLRYNSEFFELVDGSVKTEGVNVNSQQLSGSWSGWNEFVIGAWSSNAEGDTWENPYTLITFSLKAVKAGMTSLLQRDAGVYVTNGMDKYESESNDANETIKDTSSGGSGSSGGSTGGGTGTGSGSSGGSTGSGTGTGSGSSGGSTGSGTGTGSGSSGGSTGGGTGTGSGSSGGSTGTENSPSAAFSDVPAGAWYREAVDYAVENGLFNGTGESSFSPNAGMTRSMLVTVLWRLAGTPEASAHITFTDVPDGKWYTEAVRWAYENNIVTGYSDVSFGTSDAVTRQQLAAILYRYAEKCGMDISASSDISGYEDAGKTAGWASDAMKWAVASGIITGTSQTQLSPSGTASRAQVAAMIMRFDSAAR